MAFVILGTTKLYYIQQGEQGIPVVFVHGAAGTHRHWGSQVHALRAVARAVAVDLPGHGKSDPPGRNAVPAYAEVIVRVLDALAFDRAVVVGHSMGGAIAQTLAIAYPDRIAGVGLVGTGARLRVLPKILDGVITPSEFEATTQFVVDNSYATELDPDMRRRAEEEFRACPPQVTHDDYEACNNFDMMSRIADIHAPALVVGGSEDKMTPFKYSEFLASKIPNAQLVRVEGAGHNVMIEKADEVNRALLNFLTKL